MLPYFRRGFLASSAINQFGFSITYLCLLTLSIKSNPVIGVVWIFSAQYFAIAVSGTLMGLISHFISPVSIIRLSEVIRLFLISFLVFKNKVSLELLVSASFIIQLFEGFYNPCRFHFINNVFKEESEKNSFIAQLQSADNSAMLIGPAVAGILISILGVKIGFLIDAITYLINSLFWISIKNKSSIVKNRTHPWKGYQLLFSNISLLKMNIGKLFGNVLFVVWSIFLPIIIQSNYLKSSFPKIQGIAMGIMALGLLLTNLIISKLIFFKRKQSIDILFLNSSIWSTIIAISFLGYLVIFKIQSYAIIILFTAAFFFGISNAGLRTAGILIGQKITPKEYLHLVIAASDSLVRLITAGVSLIIGFLFNYYNLPLVYCFALITSLIFSFAAVSFYKKARLHNFSLEKT